MWYWCCNSDLISLSQHEVFNSQGGRNSTRHFSENQSSDKKERELMADVEWLAIAGRQVGHRLLVSEWLIMCNSIITQGRVIYELAPCVPSEASSQPAGFLLFVQKKGGKGRKTDWCATWVAHGPNPVLPWVISMGSQLLYLLNRALQQQIWKCPCRSLAIRCYQLLSFLDICLKNIFLKDIPFPGFRI